MDGMGKGDADNEDKERMRLSEETEAHLEQTALTYNLTATNVKSILTHFLKNDQVLTMLGQSSKESVDFPCLKLTRNKTRQLVEKGEDLGWPLSPSKAETSVSAKTFLDVHYDDDEDDEEYLPDADETAGTSSYDTRSKRSLCGIPIEHLEAPLFSMQPDFNLELKPLHETDEAYLNFLSSAVAQPSENRDDEDSNDSEYNFLGDTEHVDRDELRVDRATKISKRELRELLADFVELFDNDEKHADANETVDDAETASVSSASATSTPLRKKRARTPSCAEDARDTDQVVLSVRNCWPANFNFKPTGQEIVVNVDRETSTGVEDGQQFNPFLFGNDSTDYSATLLHDENRLPMFTNTEKSQLQEQMRQHVQLLAQSFLLSKCTDGYEKEQTVSLQRLNEIECNRSESSLGDTSLFNVFNLPFALQIVQQNLKYSLFQRIDKMPKNKKIFPPIFISSVLKSKCFVYLNLLPRCLPLNGEKLMEKKRLPQISYWEDVLLALGYLQFAVIFDWKQSYGLFRHIREFCLPVRSMEILKNHWVRRTHSTDGAPNVMMEACFHKHYPEISRQVTPFDCHTVVEPVLRKDFNSAPSWLRKKIRKLSTSLTISNDIVIRPVNYNGGLANSSVMDGYLTDSAGNRFSVRFDPLAPSPGLKFQISAQSSSSGSDPCSLRYTTNCTTVDGQLARRSSKSDENYEPIECTYVDISTPISCMEEDSSTSDAVLNATSNICNFSSESSSAISCNDDEQTLLIDYLKCSAIRRNRFRTKVKDLPTAKRPSPTKKAINFLNRLNALRSSPAEKHAVTKRLWKTNRQKKFARFPSRLVKAISASSPPQMSPERCTEQLDDSLIAFELLDGKSRNRAKRFRTQRGDVLKSMFTADTQLEESVNEAMASGFLKALKDGLFMHQSQLETLFRVASSKENSLQVFGSLVKILCEKPRPHKNLCHMLTMFLRSEQALDLNCRLLNRNQQTAIKTLTKLERYMGSQKYRTLLKTFLRRVKNHPSEWTCESFYDEVRHTFNVVEYAALWHQLRQLFDEETCDHRSFEMDSFEMVDENAFRKGGEVFEDICLGWVFNADNNFTIQRSCSCACHKSSGFTPSCNSCKIKFHRGKTYVCRSGRFIPAIIHANYPEYLDSDSCQIQENVVDNDKDGSTLVVTLQNNANIRRLMNFVDVVEKGQHDAVCPDHQSHSSFIDWTEDLDRFLLQQLRVCNNLDKTCQLAAKKLNMPSSTINERLLLLVDMLDSDDKNKK